MLFCWIESAEPVLPFKKNVPEINTLDDAVKHIPEVSKKFGLPKKEEPKILPNDTFHHFSSIYFPYFPRLIPRNLQQDLPNGPPNLSI